MQHRKSFTTFNKKANPNMLSFLSFIVLSTFATSLATGESTDLTTFFTGSNGLRAIGKASDRLSYTASNAGDFNKDGFEDFILGSHFFDTATITNAGLALIVLGGDYTSAAEIDTDTFTSGSRGMRIIGGFADAAVGTAVAAAGDVNTDGYADILFSSTSSTATNRHWFVIFGKAGPYSDMTITSSLTAGTWGFRILGPTGFAGVGTIRGTLGDVNGDGRDDFAVCITGNTYSTRTNAGSVWIIYGKASTATVTAVTLSSIGSAGIQLGGAATSDALGYAIAGVGDVNGDGKKDILISATGHDVAATTTRTNAGIAYLIYGSSSLVSTDMSTFSSGSKGIRYLGGATSDALGTALTGLGDINSDGKADFAISAPGVDPKSAVFVVFGSSTVRTTDVDMAAFAAGSGGYAIYGKVSNSLLGYAISAAGDQNQDGVPDILISHVGSFVYLVYCTATPTAHNYMLTDTNYWIFTPPSTTQTALGWIVDGGKDYDKDGIPDMLIGANQFSLTPAAGGAIRSQGGAAFAVYGPHIPATDAPSADPSASPTAAPTSDGSAAPSADPTADPSASPTENPSAAPTAVPTLSPSASPSAAPTTAAPTNDGSQPPSAPPTARPSATPTTAPPSVSPTPDPSAAPTVSPTRQPTQDPSAAPTEQPSTAPTETPTASPSAVPTTAAPTNDGSQPPSADPTVKPTGAPTVDPTASPSAPPTENPSAAPTVDPTISPSASPTANPSAAPTLDPTASPSALPTANPSAAPTLDPTASPSAIPTADPSADPTAAPTANPTQDPTANPSADPTAAPTADPTASPTADPSADPTAVPTAEPTFLPTAVPTAVPTIRPTMEEQQDYVVTLVVVQTVYFMSAENYFAQQAAYNLTIQHTVAASMDGVSPDGVTDIIVTEAAAAAAKMRLNTPRAAAVDSCFLSYTVSVHDPLLSVDDLRAQLIESASSGAMDTDLRTYAAEFGAENLANGTFSAPRFREASDESNLPTEAETTAMTICIIVGVCLIFALVLCATRRSSDSEDKKHQELPTQTGGEFAPVPTEAAVEIYVPVDAGEIA